MTAPTFPPIPLSSFFFHAIKKSLAQNLCARSTRFFLLSRVENISSKVPLWSSHFHIRKSLNNFRSCLSDHKKKLFSALNFPRTSSGTMQQNNYLPRSNPRTKKGLVGFHICILKGNASLILIPKRMLIRFPATSVCEQTGWAKIYAAMN